MGEIMMIDKKTFSETYALILALGEDYIQKLPDDVFDFIKSQSERYLMPQIDENKPLDQQGLSKNAMAMIAILRLEYWCNSEEEKAEFLAYLESNQEKLNEILRSTSSARELINLIRNN